MATALVLNAGLVRTGAPYCELEMISQDYLKDHVTQIWSLPPHTSPMLPKVTEPEPHLPRVQVGTKGIWS